MVTCQTCGDKNGDIYIDGNITASKTTAKPGENIELTVNIRNTSSWNYYWVYVCLTDNQTGQSSVSARLRLEPVPIFGSGKNLIQYKLIYVMQNTNVGLAISVIEESNNSCESTRVVNLYVDTGAGVHNECIEGTCVERPGIASDQCTGLGLPCTGVGEGTICTSANDMNVMGICVPKPLVLGAFALAAIYIFKS